MLILNTLGVCTRAQLQVEYLLLKGCARVVTMGMLCIGFMK